MQAEAVVSYGICSDLPYIRFGLRKLLKAFQVVPVVFQSLSTLVLPYFAVCEEVMDGVFEEHGW